MEVYPSKKKNHQNFAAYQVIFFSLFIHFRQASVDWILILLKKTAGVKSTFNIYQIHWASHLTYILMLAFISLTFLKLILF